MDNSLDRPALYYPYIHIRSEHWLKATLLCVPSLKRIVPDTYTPEDDPQIAKYVGIEGPNGPLLQSVPVLSAAADAAQRRLLEKIRAHKAEIVSRFGRHEAPQPDNYWIHDAKFNDQLLHYLIEHELAWHSPHSHGYGHRTWYALHPLLGSAVMTILGLSIANEQDYGIVTPSEEFHETLLATRERDVFETVLAQDHPKRVVTASQVRRDLGQLVITLSGVNFQALRPEDIPELQTSKSFRKFQRLVRDKARSVGRDDNPDAYRRQLIDEAQEIIDAWQDIRGEVRSGLQDTLFEQGLVLSSETLKGLFLGFGAADLLSAGGVGIGLLIRKAFAAARERRRGSYRYLTQVDRAQSPILRLTFPLGLER